MPSPRRQEDQQQAQAVEAEVKPDAELRDPGPIDIGEPCAVGGDATAPYVLRPQHQDQRKIDRQDRRARASAAKQWLRRSPNPASTPPMSGVRMSQSRIMRTRRIAMRMMEPAAIAAAYRRTRPVSECAESPVGCLAQQSHAAVEAVDEVAPGRPGQTRETGGPGSGRRASRIPSRFPRSAAAPARRRLDQRLSEGRPAPERDIGDADAQQGNDGGDRRQPVSRLDPADTAAGWAGSADCISLVKLGTLPR